MCFRPQVWGGRHLRTETDPVSETSCFLVPRIPDDVKSKNPVILSVMHHCQNHLESTCLIIFGTPV
jgi:hypothetical protein